MPMASFLRLVHLTGLVLAVGAATAKVALLLRSRADERLRQAYLDVIKTLTRQIVAGLALLTVSGIGWIVLGYPLSRVLIVKIILVASIWVAGPVIDKILEPRFRRLAPAPGQAESAEFRAARTRYVVVEITATALFFAIIVLWTVA